LQAVRFLQEPDPAAAVFTYQGAFQAMRSRVARLQSIDTANHDDFATQARVFVKYM